jgi:hypothetical protein
VRATAHSCASSSRCSSNASCPAWRSPGEPLAPAATVGLSDNVSCVARVWSSHKHTSCRNTDQQSRPAHELNAAALACKRCAAGGRTAATSRQQQPLVMRAVRLRRHSRLAAANLARWPRCWAGCPTGRRWRCWAARGRCCTTTYGRPWRCSWPRTQLRLFCTGSCTASQTTVRLLCGGAACGAHWPVVCACRRTHPLLAAVARACRTLAAHTLRLASPNSLLQWRSSRWACPSAAWPTPGGW